MLTLILLIVVAICIALTFCIIKIGDIESIECLTFFSGLVGFILLIAVLVALYQFVWVAKTL